MAEQNKVLNSKQIAEIILKLNSGFTVAEIAGTAPETLEGLYALAYNLYNSASYKDAETIFKALCIYNYKDVRYWMGLGGCRQALGEFKGAIDAYSMAGTLGMLADPTPFLYAARCYLELGDKDSATKALRGLITLGQEDNPKHAECRAKAKAILAFLEK